MMLNNAETMQLKNFGYNFIVVRLGERCDRYINAVIYLKQTLYIAAI